MENQALDFGQTFKKIRQQRGFKLENFEYLGITKSALSRFERGTNSLDIDRLYTALDAMNVPLYEYEQFLIDFTHGHFDETYQEIRQAYYAKDTQKLEKLRKSSHDYHLKLAIKGLLIEFGLEDDFTRDERDHLLELFYETDEWGIYELSILSCVLSHFSRKRITSLLTELGNRTINYHHILHYRRRVVRLFLTGALGLIKLGAKDESYEAIQNARVFTHEDNFYSLQLCYFFEGMWKAKFRAGDEGLNQIRQALSIFETLGTEERTQFFRDIANRYLKKIY
ncbi:MAG: helix-turn-helix domain-containing protein [Streptococcaceae bacterium]|jgi:Rgg/GadR/MutR family transcriptional activator|nr:helix-turn-helix domain-containing protein [Streptococcaceae bacterium]